MIDIQEAFRTGFHHFCFGFAYGMGILIPTFAVFFVAGFIRVIFYPPIIKKEDNETRR